MRILNNTGFRFTFFKSFSYLSFGRHGPVSDVLELKTSSFTNQLKQTEVLLRNVAASVNPADINTIEGKYPSPLRNSFNIPGNEGVAQVTKVGEKVSKFKAGDVVIPMSLQLGTWCTEMVVSEDDICSIPKSLSLPIATTFFVNPATAYRLIFDYLPFDFLSTLKAQPMSIIQNGANSSVGQAVIQIGSILGLNTINVIREKTPGENVKIINYLKSIGADIVLTDTEIRQHGFLRDLLIERNIPRPSLALDCVGGPKSVAELGRQLMNGSSIVTYGAMSMKPISVPAGLFIFKNIALRGFWLSEWRKRVPATDIEFTTMFESLIEWYTSGALKPPETAIVSFDQSLEAFKNLDLFKGKKIILHMSDIE